MRLKTYVSLITIVSIAAIGGLFIVKKPDGTPWLTLEDVTHSSSNITRVYRWKEQGTWSYAGEIPDDIPVELVEMIEINPDTNLIQGLKPEKSEDQNKGLQTLSSFGQNESNSKQEGSSSMSIPVPLTIQPDQLNQLFEDAKSIQSFMNERTNSLDAQTDY